MEEFTLMNTTTIVDAVLGRVTAVGEGDVTYSKVRKEKPMAEIISCLELQFLRVRTGII